MPLALLGSLFRFASEALLLCGFRLDFLLCEVFLVEGVGVKGFCCLGVIPICRREVEFDELMHRNGTYREREAECRMMQQADKA